MNTPLNLNLGDTSLLQQRTPFSSMGSRAMSGASGIKKYFHYTMSLLCILSILIVIITHYGFSDNTRGYSVACISCLFLLSSSVAMRYLPILR